MGLTVEKFDELLYQCTENHIEDICLLDAMLVFCAAGGPDVKQLEFLAGVADALRLSKTKIEWLSKLARVLLEQDSNGYQKLRKEMPKDLRNQLLPRIICYLKQFVVGVLVDTEGLYYLYAPEKTVISVDDLPRNQYGQIAISRRKVILENIVIRLEGAWEQVSFRNSDMVTMKNSVFAGICFQCSAVAAAELINCEFTLFFVMEKSCCHTVRLLTA